MNKKWRIPLCMLPLLLAPVFLWHDSVMAVLRRLGAGGFCYFYRKTGYYCPGCGSTRAVLALLDGHPLLSVHENPLIAVCAVIAVLGYTELVCLSFGKKIRLLPRSYLAWGVFVGLYLVWALVRNFVPALMPVT